MLNRATVAGAAMLFVPMINRGYYRIFAGNTTAYSARAIDLILSSLVIDMLSPLTLNFDKQAKWLANPDSFTAADLQPFKESGINVFHPAIGLGGPDAYEKTLQFFASWNSFIANGDEYFMRIDSADDPTSLPRLRA
jgi:membrane dipeptidase